jgi:hypothetical protein
MRLTPEGVESMGIESGKHFCHRQANPKCDSPAEQVDFRFTVTEDVDVGGVVVVGEDDDVESLCP